MIRSKAKGEGSKAKAETAQAVEKEGGNEGATVSKTMGNEV